MSMTNDGDNGGEQCIEKNLFYRVVSGMHASIAGTFIKRIFEF